MSESPGRFSRLAGPSLAALMVLCCLAGPLLIGALGALTANALFGIGAAAVVLVGLSLILGRRLRSGGGASC